MHSINANARSITATSLAWRGMFVRTPIDVRRSRRTCRTKVVGGIYSTRLLMMAPRFNDFLVLNGHLAVITPRK